MADSDATGGQSIAPGGLRRGQELDGAKQGGQRGAAVGPETPLSKADAKSYARRFSTV